MNYPTKQKVADDLALYTNTETLITDYATKVQVDTKLQDYTKTEDLVLNYATKEDVGADLTGYTKTEDLILNYATKQQLSDELSNYTKTTDLTLNYPTKKTVDDLFLNYVTAQSFNNAIKDYIKTLDVDKKLEAYTDTEKLNSDYALKTELHEHNNKTVIDNLSTNEAGKLLYQGAEISTDAITISQEPANAILQKEDGIFVEDKTKPLAQINQNIDLILNNQDHVNTEVNRFFDAFVPGPINEIQELEDSPVGHIISFMGTEIPSHYLACDGVVYHTLEYPILANHILANFGSINYFGGDGVMTFAVPILSSNSLGDNASLIKYYIKYEPTFFVNINNVVEPTIIDIDKEIMETLELLQEGMGVNQAVTDTLTILNSSEAVIIEPELQLIVSDTINVLNSNDVIVIDMEMQTAISETIDVLNQ